MNWKITNNLRTTFNRMSSGAGFATERRWFSLKHLFLDKVGLMPNWAIDRDVIIPKLSEVLSQRHMTKMNAAAFLCALSIKHVHSHYDPVTFLGNFLKLYNAKTIQEICEIEEIAPGSSAHKELWSVYHSAPGKNTKRIEAVKIRCWARDLERATNPKGRWAFPGHQRQSITVTDIEELLKHYPSQMRIPDGEEEVLEIVEKLQESDGSRTNSAFPKDDYLPLLRDLRAKGQINETQCGILLCFILHSREKRNDKKTSYVTHPMAVANLVRQHGERYGLNSRDVWMATLAALLHDGGEKSNINLDQDLDGLLPPQVVEAIKCLHKRDDESYSQYLERCASNPLAAVVKLCDIYHNSMDAGSNPAFKQVYVYPIAANYVQYRLKHPNEKLSVAEFVKHNKICSEEAFTEIERIAQHDTDKKKPASAYRNSLGDLNNLKTMDDILSETIISNEEDPVAHADSRRKEDPSLQP